MFVYGNQLFRWRHLWRARQTRSKAEIVLFIQSELIFLLPSNMKRYTPVFRDMREGERKAFKKIDLTSLMTEAMIERKNPWGWSLFLGLRARNMNNSVNSTVNKLFLIICILCEQKKATWEHNERQANFSSSLFDSLPPFDVYYVYDLMMLISIFMYERKSWSRNNENKRNCKYSRRWIGIDCVVVQSSLFVRLFCAFHWQLDGCGKLASEQKLSDERKQQICAGRGLKKFDISPVQRQRETSLPKQPSIFWLM